MANLEDKYSCFYHEARAVFSLRSLTTLNTMSSLTTSSLWTLWPDHFWIIVINFLSHRFDNQRWLWKCSCYWEHWNVPSCARLFDPFISRPRYTGTFFLPQVHWYSDCSLVWAIEQYIALQWTNPSDPNGCSGPAIHQIGRSPISNSLSSSWGLSIHVWG